MNRVLPERDQSRAVYFKCSDSTYCQLKRFAADNEMTMGIAIITLVRAGIEREDRRNRRAAK